MSADDEEVWQRGDVTDYPGTLDSEPNDFALDERVGAALGEHAALVLIGDGGTVVLPHGPAVRRRLTEMDGAVDLSEPCGEAHQRRVVLLLERIAAALENGSASQGRGPRARSGLLTKAEAARFVGVSERSFERRVMRDLSAVRVGRRSFYDIEEIERWLEGQKDGSSRSTSARRSTWSGSRSAADATSAARANAILAELRSPPRGSTQKSSETPSKRSPRQSTSNRNRSRHR